MKTRLLLAFCLPLAALAAQHRHGATAAASVPGPADNPDCARSADCPLNLATPATPTSLSATDLLFAIGEERVAHDLYAAASAKWSLRAFANIAGAETRHAAALTQLAASAGVVPPAAQPGVYASADLQHLYDQLITLANESETGALRAGALLEETDIADLRRLAAKATDEATRAVLANLERASAHHLAAFVRNLAVRGITYQPQVLKAEDFSALTSAAPGRGGACGAGGADCPAGPGGGAGRGYRGGR